ncbi:hypothetical protein V5P93_006791 [Actinokineospora auranticolor]|uniref:Type VII secretion system (Wss) protein ESAT-6 n=1 Tax=Actinokineospora auranticolor TaxID=155976 RepID=A0A2S6GWH0_9PSEU|nr:hypothetical protein [Actinokineospora auranticolor]PPK69564.1 hypothetical protein CLV40_103174 [Actinokineospora auranticolor]
MRAQWQDDSDWQPAEIDVGRYFEADTGEAVLAESAPVEASAGAAHSPRAGAPSLASAQPPADQVPTVQGGLDGPDIEANISSYLDFLTRLCRELGMPDPVEEYFAPVVGRWSDMHAEAERWRTVGAVSELVVNDLTQPLGGLDAAWKGADADSFIGYMAKVGLAGNDMSDAMIAMGEVLDATADGLREIVTEMAGLLAEVAETGKQSTSGPGRNDDRTRQYLDAVNRPTRELFEAVRQVLEALVRLCDSLDGSKVFDTVAMEHKFPGENWAFAEVPEVTVPKTPVTPPTSESVPAGAGFEPSGGGGFGGGGGGLGGGGIGAGAGTGATPTPPQPGGYVSAGEAPPSRPGGMPAPLAAAAESGGGRGGGGGMMGGMPMGGMMGGMGHGAGGSNEHKPRTRVAGNPQDIFGKPAKSSPAVIGDN